MTLMLPNVIPELNSGQALSEARVEGSRVLPNVILSEARVEGSRGTRRELLYNTR